MTRAKGCPQLPSLSSIKASVKGIWSGPPLEGTGRRIGAQHVPVRSTPHAVPALAEPLGRARGCASSTPSPIDPPPLRQRWPPRPSERRSPALSRLAHVRQLYALLADLESRTGAPRRLGAATTVWAGRTYPSAHRRPESPGLARRRVRLPGPALRRDRTDGAEGHPGARSPITV
jgi:hypothetical protein